VIVTATLAAVIVIALSRHSVALRGTLSSTYRKIATAQVNGSGEQPKDSALPDFAFRRIRFGVPKAPLTAHFTALIRYRC
jgi:hypothetical protein